jgi:uncharacterized protein YebE (UPF0316 family)
MVQELLAGPAGPFVIFGLRIVDVSMGTVRVLLVVRNAKVLVPLIGFFEILIWISAVSGVVANLDSPLLMVGYAGGFATGNVIGLHIEERIALGLATVRTVVMEEGARVAGVLRQAGFGVTEMEGMGRDGPVEVLYSVIPRRHVQRFLAILDREAPRSFVVVDEPRGIRRGWMFPSRKK